MPIVQSLSNLSYKIAKKALFKMDPERAHHLTLAGMRQAAALDLAPLITPPSAFTGGPVKVMGLEFPNRVGLAAGMDKAGDCVDGFGALGFGFVEVGTVTPRPQPGNEKPRLFRLVEHEAIINRMGFNNPGIDDLLSNLRKSHRQYQGVVGINIGKNFDTPNEQAVDDYLIGLRKAYQTADYIAVNISSPNTKNLRDLQSPDAAGALIRSLKDEQQKLADAHQKYTPIAIKIAPDLSDDAIAALAELFLETKIDAVIATNTTIDRESVKEHPLAAEAGGLSGKILLPQSTHVIRTLNTVLGNDIPIIGVGGISTKADAEQKLAAGATLVQIYTALVYQGPKLVSELATL